MLSLIESTNAFRVVARTGSRLPAHCTVQGKIMLAHMTRAEVKRILREHGMQAYTTNTYRSYEELEPELRRIREQGYAVDNSEYHAGLCSVAAPIYEENGTCAYSFSHRQHAAPHRLAGVFARAQPGAHRRAGHLLFPRLPRGRLCNVIEVPTTMGVLAPVGPEGKPPGGADAPLARLRPMRGAVGRGRGRLLWRPAFYADGPSAARRVKRKRPPSL